MDADSAEEAPLPPLQIHPSSSLPGSSVPIRAPLTIDSDSEFGLSINDQFYSRTSSFNSSSSIDISSYGDDHDSVHEEQEAYPDEEIVIESSHVKEYTFTTPFVKYPDGNYAKVSTSFDESAFFRPFVKYPDGNYVKESSSFDDPAIFRPFVKTPCEEISGSEFGMKLGVPVAHLTSDCDSDVDVDSVDGHRWLDSGSIPADGDPDEELRIEGVCLGDDIKDIDDSSGSIKGLVSVESIEDEPQKVEFLNEVVGSVSVEVIEDDENRKVECLNEVCGLISVEMIEECLNEVSGPISVETVEDDEGQKGECLNEVSGSDSVALIEDMGQKIECLNEVEKVPESDELSFDLKRIDAQIVSDSDNEIEIETEVENSNESKQELMLNCYTNEPKTTLSENDEKTQAKMQPIRAKFLKLINLLGLSNEENGNVEFDFCLTILVIGKTGVGKSASINSIFGENKAATNAFHCGTTNVQEIIGNVNGIHLRILDTPGLKCCPSDQSYNLKILSSIKRFTQKHTPDFVLYVDRLDTHTRDISDSHLLKLITSSLGSWVWCNCMIALTHSSSLDGFVLERCRLLQEDIISLGDGNRLMPNPVWLVENHPRYKQDGGWRNRVLFDLDCGLEGCDPADEDECDRAPRFERLTDSRNAVKRNVECKKAYFKDYGHCVKLLGKKHWSLGVRLYS